MQNQILLFDEADGIVTLTLNDPDKYNTLSEEMLDALEAAIARIAESKTAQCLVIAAEGRAFSAGHNLKQMRANQDETYFIALFARCGRFMQSLINLPVPVIAKVQGLATAAGCQLVASCDLAFASRQAKFAVSGVNLGLYCSTPAVALSRNIGRKRAFEMLTTGAFISAEQAAEWGLINRAVDPDMLDAAISELTQSITAKSPVPQRIGKALFYRQIEAPLTKAYDDAGQTMAQNMMSADAVEGIDAFIEKRDPKWTGK